MGSVEPLLINDVGPLTEFHEIPAVSVFQMRSYIGVPIILSSGRVYGTLCALDRKVTSNTQRDLDYLLLLARLLASQLDRRELGIAEERNRIAREIHDTLAQTLAALVLDLGAYADDPRLDAPDLVLEARSLSERAREALHEVRRSIWNLQPGQLAGRTLAEAIGAEVRALGRDGVSATLEVRGEARDLPANVETALLRIAQEALANVRKHAHALSAIVTLEFGEQDITLRVEDDGRGITTANIGPPTQQRGFGIHSMRERARTTGGELSVFPRPGGGTSLVCRVPRAGAVLPPTPAPTLPPRTAARRPQTSIGIIDDHALVREGLRRLLESAPDIRVVFDAGDGVSGLSLIRQYRPEVILLDIQMPHLGGLQVLEQLGKDDTPPRAIVLTTYAQDEMVYQAMRLGARGYLLKDTTGAELRNAISAVAGGGALLTPLAASRLAESLHNREALTAREREVLALLAEGLRNKEIAARLGASEKTVQFHNANIFGKLGAQNRTEAVRIARERGLLLPE